MKKNVRFRRFLVMGEELGQNCALLAHFDGIIPPGWAGRGAQDWTGASGRLGRSIQDGVSAFLRVLQPDSPPALQMHGDAFRVRQDVFLDGNGDVGERMVSQQMVGDVGGQRLDEVARAGGGEGLDFQRDLIVVDGPGDVVGETVEVLGRRHVDGDEQRLESGAFFIRHADVGADAEAADLDGVHMGI